jgi:hypothetical protein
MVTARKLDRDTIIQALVNALEPLDYVHALWEEAPRLGTESTNGQT